MGYGTPGKFNEIRELALRIVIKAEQAAKIEDQFGEDEYWQTCDELVAETRALAEEQGCELADPREEVEAELRRKVNA